MDSVNKNIAAHNELDEDNNPTGGYVQLVVPIDDEGNERHALIILWQDGPRGREDGTLADPNGAFVEDVLWAAKQRLEFFQDSKFRDDHNDVAIIHIQQALDALTARTKERADRGVEGKHEV